MNFINRRLEELEDAVAAEVKLRREGSPSLPPEVAQLWERFAEGHLGEGLAGARALIAAAPSEGGALHVAAQNALTEFSGRIDRRLIRAGHLLNDGRLFEAERELEGMGEELKGEPELRQRYVELDEILRSEANGTERAASADLSKILEKIASKGLKKPSIKALKKLAKKYAGTKTATRAEHLLVLTEKTP